MAKDEKLFLLGLGLVVGWTVVLGMTTWLEDLPCLLSPVNCSSGRGIAQVVLFAPLVIGSAFIPAGMFYGSNEKDFPKPLKVLAGIGVMAVILFITFWAIAFIGLAAHGIGG